MSSRSLASVFFAAAGAPGWFAVAASLGGLSPLQLLGYILAGAVASGAAGAIAAPLLASEAERGAPLRKGAVLGVFVSALGVALGSAVVAVAAAGLSFDVAGAFVAAFGSFLFALFPWLALGAGAGALFYYLRRGRVLGAV